MIEIKDGSIKIGERCLFSGLSFIVRGGETVVVTGSHGSGKTALLKAFLGLQPLDGGFVCFDGEPVLPATSRLFRRQVAYVPQDMPLLSCHAIDFIDMLFGLRVNRKADYSRRDLSEEWGALRIDTSLAESPLDSVRYDVRRRIVLSAAGLLRKPVLIADEPFLGQDDDGVETVSAWLRGVAVRRAAVLVSVGVDDAVLPGGFDRVVNL